MFQRIAMRLLLLALLAGCSSASPDPRWARVMTVPAEDASEAELQRVYRELETEQRRMTQRSALQSADEVAAWASDVTRVVEAYRTIALESNDPRLASSALVRAADAYQHLASQVASLQAPEGVEDLEVHRALMGEIAARFADRSLEYDMQALAIADTYGVESPPVERAHGRLLGRLEAMKDEERAHYDNFRALTRRQVELETASPPSIVDEAALQSWVSEQTQEAVDLVSRLETVATGTGDPALAVSARVHQGDVIWGLAERLRRLELPQDVAADVREALELRTALLSTELERRARGLYRIAVVEAHERDVAEGDALARAMERGAEP